MVFRKKKEDGAVIYTKTSKLPMILVVAVIALSLIIGVKLGSDWQQVKLEEQFHQKEITSDTLKQEMTNIGELATVNYFYTNMGKFEDTLKLMELNLPLTTKSFILSYDGTMKAGIDISLISIEMVENVITVTVPEIQILSHEIDMDSVVFYDEKNSIFNGLSAEDVTDFLANQKVLMEEKAVASGFLERAMEQTLNVIEHSLNNILYGNQEEIEYKIEFVLPNADNEE